MKKLFIYLLFNSCCTQRIPIKRSVEGFVYDKKSKLPLESVSVKFLETYKASIWRFRDSLYTKDKGFFKLPEIKMKLCHTQGKDYQLGLANHIEFRKVGYVTDTIYSLDSIYRIDNEKNAIYIHNYPKVVN